MLVVKIVSPNTFWIIPNGETDARAMDIVCDKMLYLTAKVAKFFAKFARLFTHN
jgi:hypothetical protein